MDKTLIIILSIILFVLVLLNNLKFVITNVDSVSDTDIKHGNCSQTKFGCCPDGVNSKIDYYGKNCPNYNPGTGYPDNKPDAVIVTNV